MFSRGTGDVFPETPADSRGWLADLLTVLFFILWSYFVVVVVIKTGKKKAKVKSCHSGQQENHEA